MSESYLTIGQLARRVGLQSSALRYYEELGLLIPARRSQAGYRLYDAEAEQTLHFIQRAQRLGFSLTDIRTLLDHTYDDTLSDERVVAIAENRLLDLERRLTEVAILRHELALLLIEFRERRLQRQDEPSRSLFDRLVDRVCEDDRYRPNPDQLLDWIIERTHCALGTSNGQHLLATLRDQHVHIWKEKDVYQILVVSRDPAVEDALRTLAQMEADCQVHIAPKLERHEEGFLFTARGENAFLFARLFLALEE
jgi:DNA-binding transcriptional MerR regulator